MRLVRAQDFERVFRRPLRSSDTLFTVLARKSHHSSPRLGLAISRRHVGKAVARNRVKRLVRESFRKHTVQLQRLDVVVLARPGLKTVDRHRMFSSLKGHWTRLVKRCRDCSEA